MSFDAKVKVLCRPTAALSDLRKGLNAADLPLRKNVKLKPGMEPKRKDVAGGTKLQSAVRQCSDAFMLTATGRKALLLFTDGVDEGSRTTLEQAIDDAQRADTVVYSIMYADPRRSGGLQVATGRHILTELARQTGGGFSSLRKSRHWNRSSMRFRRNCGRSTASDLSRKVRGQVSTGNYRCRPRGRGWRCRPARGIMRGKHGTQIASAGSGG
jgi:hypothetical protein